MQERNMSILDDLFTNGQTLYSGASSGATPGSVLVDVGITTNVTRGLSTSENIAISWPTITLTYHPDYIVPGPVPGTELRSVRNFSESGDASGLAVLIIPPDFEPTPHGYEISIVNSFTKLNLKFSPSIDGHTNILWGHSGATFITVSLCNLRVFLPKSM
jgi:hypothetical protein